MKTNKITVYFFALIFIFINKSYSNELTPEQLAAKTGASIPHNMFSENEPDVEKIGAVPYIIKKCSDIFSKNKNLRPYCIKAGLAENDRILGSLVSDMTGENQSIKETKEIKRNQKSIYDICNGYPQQSPTMNSFPDPYEVKGKCYFTEVNSPFQDIQWINNNTLLISTISQLNGNRTPVIFFDPNEHVKYGHNAIVIGTTPYRYTSTMGALVVAPTFRILKYEDSNIDIDGSGSLGEPRHAVKANLVYPQNEIESNTQGSVKLSCKMHEDNYGLWSTNECLPIDKNTNQDFINSSIEAAYHSTWDKNEIADIDRNGYKIITYNFSIDTGN